MKLLLLPLFAIVFVSVPVYPQSSDNSDDLRTSLDEIKTLSEIHDSALQSALNNLTSSLAESSVNEKAVLGEIQKLNHNLEGLSAVSTKMDSVESTLNSTQERNEKAQMMFTVAGVSGVFVAIVGGFVTTKLFSITADKNGLGRDIRITNLKIDHQKKTIEDHEKMMDQIGRIWSKEKVEKFVNELLSANDLKVYSLEDLTKKFADASKREPDVYDEEILKENYDEITGKINEQIKENVAKMENATLTGVSKELFDPTALSGYIATPPQIVKRQIDNYDNAKTEWVHETSELDHLEKQKEHLQKELDALIVPGNIVKTIVIIFLSAFVGIVIPLTYSMWIDGVGGFYLVIGISCFFGSVLITLGLIADEIIKIIYPKRKINTDKK